MTPEEIRAIPTVNMQMKMQLEICAQTAELRDAILTLTKELISQRPKKEKETKSITSEVEGAEPSSKKIERPALK